MLKTYALLIIIAFTTFAFADESIHSYRRTRSNGTITDNYSFKGNFDP
jgi:hypothetical protein